MSFIQGKCTFHFILVGLVLLISHHSNSQTSNFKHFTTQDGLPSSVIYEAIQDRHGFMWFATPAGVSRFDGYKFTNYTVQDGLGDNEIFGFCEDSMGRIWFRSLNGKVSYFLNEKFYNSNNTPSLKSLDKPSMIRDINETADGSMLITHYRHGFVRYMQSNEAIDFLLDQSSGLYPFFGVIESPNKGYILLSHGLTVLTSQGHVVKAIPIKNVNPFKIKLINQKSFVIGDNSIIKYNEAENTFTSVVKTEGDIYNILIEGNGAMWLSTAKGAVRWNSERKSSTFFEKEQVSSTIVDMDGNKWFTTLENGIFFMANHNVTTYSTASGLSSNKVLSIDKDDEGNMWLGHDNYTLTCISNKRKISRKTIINKIPPALQSRSTHIKEVTRKGSDFMIVGQPSFYLQGDESVLLSYVAGNSIQHWYGDRYIVAGGGSGIGSFSKRWILECKQNKIYSDKLLNIRQRDFMQHLFTKTNCLFRQKDDKFWVGTDRGLVYLTKDTIINCYEENPALQGRIRDIKMDRQGNVYMATDDKGVMILRNDTVRQITVKEGLSSNYCNRIQPEDSILWVATNTGLNRVVVDQNFSVKDIHLINKTSGLPASEIYDMLVDDKHVWIGTAEGLSVMEKNINLNKRKPVTYLTGLTVNSQPVDTSRKTFDHKENSFRIEFVALSYKSMGDIHYRYRLSPSKGDSWQETKNTSVDLTLSPGLYTFEVKAQNSSGIWGEPITYSFVVQPPFWNTWWFIILTSSSVALAIYGIQRYVRSTQKEKAAARLNVQLAELKSLRSQMNYHFMSNAFNSLQGLFLSDVGVDKYLGKFSKLMRFTLENSDRHLIPLSEELEYLTIYCDIEQLRVGDRFSFRIECDAGLDAKSLQVPALTLQPFIENAIWHGIMPKEGPGTVRLTVKPNDNNTYKIIIEDDGVGLNHSLTNKGKTRKSFGTKLITDRFKVIKLQNKEYFDISIEDRLDTDGKSGTRVTITLPYNFNM